jgi:CheY-like chemotaxis protein
MASPYTVLLLDDDAAVRESAGHLLGSLGFCVLAAQNGHEAMRRLAQIQVDVLVADIVLPDLNGIDSAKRAKLFQPEIKVMFMTGYHSQPCRRRSCCHSIRCFLPQSPQRHFLRNAVSGRRPSKVPSRRPGGGPRTSQPQLVVG